MSPRLITRVYPYYVKSTSSSQPAYSTDVSVNDYRISLGFYNGFGFSGKQVYLLLDGTIDITKFKKIKFEVNCIKSDATSDFWDLNGLLINPNKTVYRKFHLNNLWRPDIHGTGIYSLEYDISTDTGYYMIAINAFCDYSGDDEESINGVIKLYKVTLIS